MSSNPATDRSLLPVAMAVGVIALLGLQLLPAAGPPAAPSVGPSESRADPRPAEQESRLVEHTPARRVQPSARAVSSVDVRPPFARTQVVNGIPVLLVHEDVPDRARPSERIGRATLTPFGELWPVQLRWTLTPVANGIHRYPEGTLVRAVDRVVYGRTLSGVTRAGVAEGQVLLGGEDALAVGADLHRGIASAIRLRWPGALDEAQWKRNSPSGFEAHPRADAPFERLYRVGLLPGHGSTFEDDLGRFVREVFLGDADLPGIAWRHRRVRRKLALLQRMYETADSRLDAAWFETLTGVNVTAPAPIAGGR